MLFTQLYLGSFLQSLGELEDKCDGPAHILKRGETVRVHQEEELVCGGGGGKMALKASMVSTSMHERMLSSCTLIIQLGILVMGAHASGYGHTIICLETYILHSTPPSIYIACMCMQYIEPELTTLL